MKSFTVLLLCVLFYASSLTFAQNVTSAIPSDPSAATPKATASISSIGKGSASSSLSNPGPTPSTSAPSISNRVPSPLPTVVQPPSSHPTNKPSSDAVTSNEKLKYTALFITLFNLCIVLLI